MKTLNKDTFIPPRPYTIWDELAQIDLLRDYLEKYKDSNLNTDPDLHKHLLESLYRYSDSPIEEVELAFCIELHNNLHNFLEKISLCRQ